MPVDAVCPWLLTPVLFLLHRRPRVQRASGIPCALFVFRGWFLQQLGRMCAARTRRRVNTPPSCFALSPRRPGQAEGGCGAYSLGTSSRTSAARSGIQNHRRKFLSRLELQPCATTKACGYGSPPARGRHLWLARRPPHPSLIYLRERDIGVCGTSALLTPRPWRSCRTSASGLRSRKMCRR
jgi:hypothetical protein